MHILFWEGFQAHKNMFEETTDIDEILNSLDGINRAEAPSFLYTRILARLNLPKRGIFENLNNLISKPAFAIFFLFLVLFLDGIALLPALGSRPGKPEHTARDVFVGESAEDLFATDDFQEIFFYAGPDNDYATGN